MIRRKYKKVNIKLLPLTHRAEGRGGPVKVRRSQGVGINREVSDE